MRLQGTMYRDYKICICIPAGRRRYMQILIPYLRVLRPVVDECVFWVNTNDPEDLHYLRQTAEGDSWFKLQRLPTGTHISHVLWHTVHKFYETACDAQTIYIKLDDDLVYMDGLDRFQGFLDLRIDNPHPFLVSANVLNNPLFSHILQQQGILGTNAGRIGRNSQDAVGMSGSSAQCLHEEVLRTLEQETSETVQFRIDNFYLYDFERFAVNCIAWFGKDFAEFRGRVPQKDESFLTEDMPRGLARPVLVAGGFLTVHFAFLLQRRHLEENTDILHRYRRLATKTDCA